MKVISRLHGIKLLLPGAGLTKINGCDVIFGGWKSYMHIKIDKGCCSQATVKNFQVLGFCSFF